MIHDAYSSYPPDEYNCFSGGIKERIFNETINGASYLTIVRTLPDGRAICFTQSTLVSTSSTANKRIVKDGSGVVVATSRAVDATHETFTCVAEGKTYDIDFGAPRPQCQTVMRPTCESGQCAWP